MFAHIPERTYCGRENTVNLLDYARANRKSGSFNDCFITVGSTYVPANRMVLSCFSSVLEDWFKSNIASRQYEIPSDVHHFDQNTIEDLVDFMYNGSIKIDCDNVVKITACADYLQLNDVRQFGFDFLLESITCDNCFHIYSIAKRYNDESFLRSVYEFISEHLRDIIFQFSAFQCITKADLVVILQNMNEYTVDEEAMFLAIVTWTDYDFKNREKEFLDLFSLIKLDKLSFEFVSNTVALNELVISNPDCVRMAVTWISQQVNEMNSVEDVPFLIESLKCNTNSHILKVCFVFGHFYVFYPALPPAISMPSLLYHQNYLYCIGGRIGKAISSEVFRLNMKIKNPQWKKVASMQAKRCCMGAAIFKKRVVVAGGFDTEEDLASVEVLSSTFNSWSRLSSMNESRTGNALVECDGKLYSIGGYNEEQNILSTVEFLTSLNQSWQYAAPMQISRNRFAVVNYKNFIYVMGGQTSKLQQPENCVITKSVEKYNSDRNSWTSVSDMIFKRTRHSACILQDRIYVFGGIDENDEEVDKIESYDLAIDKWVVVETLSVQCTDEFALVTRSNQF